MPQGQDYTVGRGEVFLARFKPDTFDALGERYIGNTPQFNINSEATNLDHFSSDRGIREKDESIVIQVNRMVNLITDSIRPENVALFFFGTREILVTAPTTGATNTFNTVEQGLYYQLGANSTRPQGARRVASVVVAPATTGAAYVAGTDYVVDTERGRIQVVEGGGIASGSNIKATFNIGGTSRSLIISGNQPVEGAMRYIAHNPEGPDIDYYCPYVKVRPNGDFALKSDEWQQLPLSVEVLKRPGYEAMYIDGQPFVV